MRVSIQDFATANPVYANGAVSFFTVSGGVKTTTLATLYAAPTGTATLTNPQQLDPDGKFRQPVYVEVPVIATISGLSTADHDTGIIASLTNVSFRVDPSTKILQYSSDNGTSWSDAGTVVFANSPIIIDTIAALKAISPPPSGSWTYLVRGYYAVGDGGGGFYWWNSSDTTADNGGTIIALNSGGTGRFNKLF